jgi:arabinogalactan endo-1,4-beta-galactosidase
MKNKTILLILSLIITNISAQSFYFGADLSYVNEMEDCGATYFENGEAKDPYTIFADHNAKLVRLRLWHTPSWYDALNNGQRYSDLSDVKKSIQRARELGMEVLLDFHLSDNWADPGKQVIPKAWEAVADDLPALSDSLYLYIYGTLEDLHKEDLLPEIVQIGNETNRGILQTQEQTDAGWSLDWSRNATLFNSAIQAVRDLEAQTNDSVQIMLHIAGPADAPWFIDNFVANGVTDFDFIGLSYYWQWHKKASLDGVGDIIRDFRQQYPDYEVMIVETGYPWTSGFNDPAGNILGESHPDFQPFSPSNQADFLIALTEQVLDNDGSGVVYWEPAWVSTTCATQWATGSHYEHATFFDFQNNLLTEGGIRWMTYEYDQLTNAKEVDLSAPFSIQYFAKDRRIVLQTAPSLDEGALYLFSVDGKLWYQNKIVLGQNEYDLSFLPSGLFLLTVLEKNRVWSKKINIW